LLSSWLRCLSEDREGNLWLGIGTSGLGVLRASKAITLQPPHGWEGCSVLSVCVGRNDALHVGTRRRRRLRVSRGQWTHFAEGSGLSNLYVWSVMEDAQGRLWAGTWGGGLFVKTGDRFERAPGTENLTAPVPALLPRPDGTYGPAPARDCSTWTAAN